jgi:hypothetical protein
MPGGKVVVYTGILSEYSQFNSEGYALLSYKPIRHEQM